MLSDKVVKIIKATAPVLEENGVLLTRHFYQKLFQNNPEVMPLFNRANQDKGSQQEALAGAICAYAKNIDNLEALKGAVELISNKHFSLKIRPEHYPIVGTNLLDSIKDVLGEAATPDIINAWSEAYFFLADILIGAEKSLSENKNSYDDFKNFKIMRKVKESDSVTSFYLSPLDNILPVYTPGQYITVRVPYDGMTTMRNYSLSSFGDKNFLRISVKKETGNNTNIPKGYVSNYLHHEMNEGDELEVGAPAGVFTLPEKGFDKDIILLAAGIGITPLLSMLYASLERNKNSIHLVYGSQNESVQAFRHEIDELESDNSQLKVNYFYDSLDRETKKNESIGYISNDYLQSIAKSEEATFYICGPKEFMSSAMKNLKSLGIAEDRVNFEFFGPLEELS